MTLEDLFKEPLQYPRREDVDALVKEAMRCLPESRSDLSSKVSHSIRTPLAAILGFKEILEMEVPVSDADRIMYHEVIAAETHRLKRFIESVKVFKAFHDGNVPEARTTGDIRQTVETAITRCEYDAKAKQIRIERIRQSTALPITADHELLCIALEQLLLNAFRATPKEGLIDIEILAQKEHLSIIIEDSGFGMDPARKDEMFKPFTRIARPDDNGGELGLGLALVRSVAEHHRGSLSAESKPMEGSRFTLTLPR